MQGVRCGLEGWCECTYRLYSMLVRTAYATATKIILYTHSLSNRCADHTPRSQPVQYAGARVYVACCEDQVPDGPASEKGSKCGPFQYCDPRTWMNYHRLEAVPWLPWLPGVMPPRSPQTAREGGSRSRMRPGSKL